jgi:hypothetical protein
MSDLQHARQGGQTRRIFLRRAGGVLTAVAAGAGAAGSAAWSAASGANSPASVRAVSSLRGRLRSRRSYDIRIAAARAQEQLPLPEHRSNGDEDRYPNKVGSFSKGFPHNELGEVDLRAYASLQRALRTGDPADFDRIRLAGVRPLTNPQGGLAFTLEGADSQHLWMAPAPALASAEEGAEIAENYWMAIARDVPFAEYDESPLIHRAAADLSRLADFSGPRIRGKVTRQTLFRGTLAGCLDGPFVSQFLLKDTPYGAELVNRLIRTSVPGLDYMVTYSDWLASQNGFAPPRQRFDRTLRYIRSGRDLAEWVHNDVLFQAYFNALLILISTGAPLDSGNPYNDIAVYRGRVAGRYWRNQTGFATLGPPYIASLVCEVAKPALAAVWFQKWFVHRRLRPEEFGGRIHNHMTKKATYSIHENILHSAALTEVFAKYGTYLLPQSYPEGAPTHPSYGAGHATVAGACVTVLKAFFDESFIIPDPVDTTSSGQGIFPYSGPYVRRELKVGGELNKLASNIAIGRNFAGIHWRSDMRESLKLGEEVAIRFLRDERRVFNERFGGFSLTRFDGQKITI